MLDNLEAFFDDLRDDGGGGGSGGFAIAPSILHGDLWSDNIGAVVVVGGGGGGRAEPAIYDPACYYGHHEAEWGMSWCAGERESERFL